MLGSTSTSVAWWYVTEGDEAGIIGADELGNEIFVSYTGDIYSTSPTVHFIVNSDMNIYKNWRPKETHTLTVQNGTGSGSYLERAEISITADTAPTGQGFSGWTVVSGTPYQEPTSSSTTTIKLGQSDVVVRAEYKNLRGIRVTTNAGNVDYTILEDNYQEINAGNPPSGQVFSHWEVTSGDASVSNPYASTTTVYAHTQNSIVVARYTSTPTFSISMINGYVWNGSNWVENTTLVRGSTNTIKLKQGSVPTGYQFYKWNIYVNGVLQTDANDIYQPFAETTRLRNFNRSITIEATFYKPDTTETRTLTINRKDGTITQDNYTVGSNVSITASTPDQGQVFWRWEGDTIYITGGVTNPNSYIYMPSQNVTITEKYQPEGFIPEYSVYMTNIYGECAYENNGQKYWVSEYNHYKQEDTVEIRATGFSNDFYFNGWTVYKHNTRINVTSLLTSPNSNPTTFLMPDYDLDIEPIITPRQDFTLKLNDGLTGGEQGLSQANYRENARADVYFAKVSTNDIHYEFTRWTGSTVSQIELYDGGMFRVSTPGTQTNPQFIKMPGQNTELTATYKTKYRVTLINGTIDTVSTSQGYFEAGVLNITADTAPTGMTFQYWSGNTSGVANIYDPTTTLTIENTAVDLRAVYSTDAERNAIGYSTSDLKSVSTISNNSITIISGEIEVGFIITDINGHIYIVTAVDTQNETSTIYRMTKITMGGNIYG